MSKIQQTAHERRQRRGGAELRTAILEAASEIFLEEGYQGASIEAVIGKVGGSKRAIYSHFGGKKELFLALVAEASSKVIGGTSPENVEGKDIRDTLRTFGLQVTRVLMAPTTLGLYRAVIAEGARQPDVAQEFFENGPGRVSESLAQVLERFQARGAISIKDSARAAERFVGMLRDDLYLRVVLGLRAPLDETEMVESVEQAVAIFMHGIAARDS
ncbi:TetR/AcrR family transcriptional regulator [Sinorhizobium mexicanum]|uniref:TetR/AcrR family transcriptional regulator n=1 Tax=Sinorhizobium mexicanum TaxID=375549 RepID=A0A859QBH1_9HYPH|nr:TetR/AcrR family transcriptional regulator [Sinorhizobium mexicanum]MBP1887982.1 AcrR family transcriptional regulator [Sinorhizobium mexicanum]QLL60033.1 TetR/AcrR family transcriptional regulator [Sinorhizobium mexicanum]